MVFYRSTYMTLDLHNRKLMELIAPIWWQCGIDFCWSWTSGLRGKFATRDEGEAATITQATYPEDYGHQPDYPNYLRLRQ